MFEDIWKELIDTEKTEEEIAETDGIWSTMDS